jgi:hypothetical protein
LIYDRHSIGVADLLARIRYFLEPAEINRYAGFVGAGGIAEVASESLDHSTKGVACTARARVNVGIGLGYFVRSDGRQCTHLYGSPQGAQLGYGKKAAGVARCGLSGKIVCQCNNNTSRPR